MYNEVTEEWKQINDYPNYSISNFGVIKNRKRIMKILTDTKGYSVIKLYKDGIQKNFQHHQPIGIHFIPNPENYKQIDHINNIRNDNRLENLRWGNQSQNCRNKKKRTNCSSQYQGVCWDKRWRTSININGKVKHIGRFDTELDAFNAWKQYVIKNNLQEFYSQVNFNETDN